MPRTTTGHLLELQRHAGNRAVALMVQRKPDSYGPAVVYSDWEAEIGERGMLTSLTHFLYENTKLSDRKFTIEDEFEAAIDIDTAYLGNPQDAQRLVIWQKQLRSAFQAVKRSMTVANWSEAVRHLVTAYDRAMAIYGLDMVAPQFDVTWKKQVRPGGEIVTRTTGTRVEALFEVQPAGAVRAEMKNLNVSLRRHWWNGLDVQSVANPAGNSLMGPRVTRGTIDEDLQAVARQYIAHVTKRGYSGEFGVDTPSGVHYHVNRLDNQQPHCFPNRGADTVSLTAREYTAAVSLSLYSKAVTNNRLPPVSTQQVRTHVQAADGIVSKLQTIGVGFSQELVKEIG